MLRGRNRFAGNHFRRASSEPVAGLRNHLADRLTDRQRARLGTLGHLCGLPTTSSRQSPPTQKPQRNPGFPGLREGLRRRGSGRSRTDDGGFAIRCLSHLATEPFVLVAGVLPSSFTLRQSGRPGQGLSTAETATVLPGAAIITVMPVNRLPEGRSFNRLVFR